MTEAASHLLGFKPDTLAARPQSNPGFLDGSRSQRRKKLAAPLKDLLGIGFPGTQVPITDLHGPPNDHCKHASCFWLAGC